MGKSEIMLEQMEVVKKHGSHASKSTAPNRNVFGDSSNLIRYFVYQQRTVNVEEGKFFKTKQDHMRQSLLYLIWQIGNAYKCLGSFHQLYFRCEQ